MNSPVLAVLGRSEVRHQTWLLHPRTGALRRGGCQLNSAAARRAATRKIRPHCPLLWKFHFLANVLRLGEPRSGSGPAATCPQPLAEAYSENLVFPDALMENSGRMKIEFLHVAMRVRH